MHLPITYLFVPGNHPARFDKALRASPDALILDLEDAVHPDSKARAREAVGAWHAATEAGPCRRYIRLNGADSGLLEKDLEWLGGLPHPARCAGIFLPKAESAQAVAGARRRLAAWHADADLVAIIETARGLHHVDAIAASGVARLAFGSLDFSLDIGCHESRDAFLLARSRIVVASRVAGLPAPIDAVTPAFSDTAAAAADARHAHGLGFAAKLCIHPAQLPAVREAFLPDTRAIGWARAVLAAAAQGGHAVQVDGKMVDRPLIEQAQRLLARAAMAAG